MTKQQKEKKKKALSPLVFLIISISSSTSAFSRIDLLPQQAVSIQLQLFLPPTAYQHLVPPAYSYYLPFPYVHSSQYPGCQQPFIDSLPSLGVRRADKPTKPGLRALLQACGRPPSNVGLFNQVMCLNGQASACPVTCLGCFAVFLLLPNLFKIASTHIFWPS